ncbi:Segregation and condensation protein A [Oceanobacillus oncorhynchi]|uniref:Segregation and condensation protein A n=1 Tax=Oceanobacillus oncorhynchi TaxID=545501 RepID=A0A0A1MYI0_9BACI|nr:segregation/condensation protein A [Oceanobacillus oncorhynchi]CEI83791.1 Segregation and condensation protein A [Oceanobacillus oncorhynchi]
MIQGYEVKLEKFEGPLDLLLHLINHYEIDIYDIPVAQITQQYMDYIHTMQHLELNIASEYLVMASTLLAIKSQMLLPKQEFEEEEMDEAYMEDPREELMQRLIEYRKYKEAAEALKEKEAKEQQVYTRSPVVFDFKDVLPENVNAGNASVFDMIGALKKMMQRNQWKEPQDTVIERTEIPIEKRMDEVLQQVKSSKNGIAFYALFPVPTKSYIVSTFVAVLELMKKREVYAIQENHFEELYVYSMEESSWN